MQQYAINKCMCSIQVFINVQFLKTVAVVLVELLPPQHFQLPIGHCAAKNDFLKTSVRGAICPQISNK